ncbi:MAG: DNA primase [Caldisericia bacterium]|nr:DNA primase [Caldisericia bacterium]MDD4614137.1 DNA primase [Caldisericia bacterium]
MDHHIEDYIQEIKTRINIVDFIGKYVSLRKAGQNFVGLCPFHVEKTPSFSVNPGKEIFYCFGCHIGGDIIHFVEKYEGLTFQEAVEELGKEAGLEPPQWGHKKTDSQYNPWYHFLKTCAEYFQQNLERHSEAQVYLHKRGIHADTVSTFQIGFAPPDPKDFIAYFTKLGFDKEDAKILGLVREKEDGYTYPYFRNRILFPILDLRKRVIGFGGRAIDQEQMPKYLNSPDHVLFHKGENLYALSLARSEMNRSKSAILVEGYMDVISLYQHGITNCTASLGTAFTLEQAKLLRKYSETLYICYDSDEAGKKAILRAIDIVLPMGFPCRVIQIPKPYKDPDEYIMAQGKESFKQLMKSAKGALEYCWEAIIEGQNLQDPITVSAVVESIFRRFMKVKDPIRIETLLKQISLDIKIKPSLLEERLYSMTRGSSYRGKAKTKRWKQESETIIDEKNATLLLKAMITQPKDWAEIIFAKLNNDDFPEGIFRELFSEFHELFLEKNNIQVENFQGDPDKENFYSKLMELQNMNNKCIEGDVIPQILCHVDSVRKKKNVLFPLKERVNKAEQEGNYEESKRLLEEILRISREEY